YPVLTPADVTDTYRLIEQPEFGAAQVPLTPTRIVTLDPSLTDAVIALGYGDAIVGTIVDYNGNVFHEHIADLLPPDVAKLGQEGAPNLERIVALKPDLILTWDWYPDNIGELQQIAPTVVMPYTTYEQQVGNTYSNEQYVTWLVREVAVVLGVAERVDAALQPFRDAVALARPLLANSLGEQSVGFVDIRQETILLSGYGSDGISALLYGDLGVRPDPLSEALYVWEELSLENVPELSADQLLAFVDGAEAEERYAELTANPLWQRVPAVQNNRVFIVPPGLYYRGDDGPLGATRVVNDIVQKLTGQELDAAARPEHAAATIGRGVGAVVGSAGSIKANGMQIFRHSADYNTAGVAFVGECGTPNLARSPRCSRAGSSDRTDDRDPPVHPPALGGDGRPGAAEPHGDLLGRDRWAGRPPTLHGDLVRHKQSPNAPGGCLPACLGRR
ncbi:ABC transporter substrate-binding protein, partial [Candidatus Gracilibacteria bacterium]|nr:ABC transporter substrate-binding protein [Candidatus Gracilibacteria bacterium]